MAASVEETDCGAKKASVDIDEALAEAVRCYPALYDKTLKEFKDRNIKANAWKKVAESVTGISSGRTMACSHCLYVSCDVDRLACTDVFVFL